MDNALILTQQHLQRGSQKETVSQITVDNKGHNENISKKVLGIVHVKMLKTMKSA